tara:strand:- start:3498 stop:4823 length:1326 start_codon:yes stop_codon:yes gene_type:complete
MADNQQEESVFRVRLDELTTDPSNVRTHGDRNLETIKGSLRRFGQQHPLVVDSNNVVVAGNGRLEAMRAEGWEDCLVIRTDLEGADRTAFAIADNRTSELAEWDTEGLAQALEGLDSLDDDLLATAGFSDDDFKEMIKDLEPPRFNGGDPGVLTRKYIQPPLSILDTRKADWLERKREWRERICDNAETREDAQAYGGMLADMNGGVSMLDPVLAELMVLWFGVVGGKAFDPFAGDTVFGFVAATCGMEFEGIELRPEQATLNQQRADSAGLNARYHCDTAANLEDYIEDDSLDLIFTCPPYADLEKYSDDPDDLSNMSHDEFFNIYGDIMRKTFSKLKNNRFAVVVMGEVRGKNGGYIGTVPGTIEIMKSAGFQFYNELILVNTFGTMPIVAGRFLTTTRKTAKAHQNVLVFLKGDGKSAATELGDISPLLLEGEVEDES